MNVEVAMPRLSDSMTEGAITSWFKNEGEAVAEGEAIAEIETDKSTVDLNAPTAGVLARIVVAAGSGNVPVGTVLAEIDSGAAVAAKPAPKREKPAAVATSSSVQPSNAGAEGEAGIAIPSSAAPQGTNAQAAAPRQTTPQQVAARPATSQPPPAASPPTATRPQPRTNGAALPDDDIAATPLARRMAAQAGLSLGTLGRSGIGGKVCKADVEQALSRATRNIAAAATSVPQPVGAKAAETPQPSVATPMSRVRRAVAERMARAKSTIPHFYLSSDCRVDRLVDVRERLKADGLAVSLNDFVIRASAIALRRVPEANASWTDAGIARHERVDIAVAVSLDDGLVTPVVRAADTLGLEAIGESVRDLATRARQGKLAPHEYDGGTFTISNLGMFGVGELFAIINPPQVCILGVGAAEPRPVVEDGKVVAGTVMTLTISADHRVLDGATGARLLAEVKRLLEEPARMLL